MNSSQSSGVVVFDPSTDPRGPTSDTPAGGLDSALESAVDKAARSLTRTVLAALNHLIQSESAAQQQLLPHAGKTLELRLTSVLPPLCLTVGSDGLLTEPAAPAAPQLTLSVQAMPAAQLIAQGRSPMSAATITGDAEFAAAVAWLAGNLRWEFEEDLSKLTGDAAAHNIAKILNVLSVSVRDGATQFEAMIKRGMADDSAPLATAVQFAPVAAGTRDLRDGLARLEQRLALLELRSPPGRDAA
jgi:ubiquinone biosynthesis accessory factor UbiJ